ncbi:hypothetical protein AZF37_05735 [endosymbiont 'TC1' of Trimyema compressum]|nr:hypothetical protein AZF37_05735 [endosymbiont 'TC1' of Trimyema compressum]
MLLYTLITFSPSVSRCFVFFVVSIIFKRFKIESSALFKLGLTSVILLIFNPYYLINIGFQLSFTIVGGLYYFSFLFKKWGFLKKFFYFGFVSFICSFPILLFYFQKTSLASILVTPLIMPIIEIVLIIGSLFLFSFSRSVVVAFWL